jgi:DNA-binding GntR family transcriptional regulator
VPPPPRQQLGRRSVLIARLRGDLGHDRPGSGQQVILDELRRIILDGDAPPGTAIPVDEVAELFGVSRIPVRESLKTLIGEGLVDHRPRSGYIVAQLTLPELSELYVLRGVLEQAAMASAVAAAGPADDGSVRQAYDDLCAAQAAADHRGYHRESRRFHLALLAPAKTQRLLRMLESAWNLTEPVRPMAQIPDTERAALHHEHKDMLDAFLARDQPRLLAVSAEHHRHLEDSIASLPADSTMLAWSEPDAPEPPPGQLPTV